MPPEKIKIMEENKMAKLTTAEFVKLIKVRCIRVK